MDAINAIGAGTGISRAAALRSSDVEARKAPEDKYRDESFSGVVDPVSLSREARIRQDVVRGTEDEDSEGSLQEDVFQSGFGAQAASAAERERVRELLLQDMKERAASAADEDDRSIRSLPSFEYDIGPYGRAYAVGEGAEIERPAPPPKVLADEQKPDVPAQSVEALPPGWGGPAMGAEARTEGDDGGEERALFDETDAARPSSAAETHEAPPSATLGDAWGEAAKSAASGPMDHQAERSVRAYASAQTLTRAPGGFETSTVDAIV